MKTPAEQDEYENSLIAAGAVLAILASSRNAALQSVDPVVDAEGNATNQLDIELGFMASPYRITIERVAAPDEKAKEAPE